MATPQRPPQQALRGRLGLVVSAPMTRFAPMLAASVDGAGPLRFPLLASPKLDGMRVSITERGPVTRGGLLLPNERLRAYLDRDELRGLDGELTFGDPVAPDVVQRSIGAGMSRKGPPPERGLSFWVFDSFAEPKAPFTERYRAAARAVKRAKLSHVHLVPQTLVRGQARLRALEAQFLELGFEGVMLRRPDAPYTFGRVKAQSQALLKMKQRQFATGEIIGVARKDSGGHALIVTHPDYTEPFEIPVYGRNAQALATADGRELIGRRVRFTRLRGSWKRAPRAPLFVGIDATR
jgi:DNA ligase 1